MRIRHKHFPYPVAAEGNNSYIDTSFRTDAAAVKEGYNVKFIFEACIDNHLLKSLIVSGDAAYVHHIECPQTCFRTAVVTDEERCEITVSDTKINGLVQICSFLAAVKDIKNYTNDAFNSDYRGFRFNLDKGCVMGIGSQFDLQIEKERDDLTNTSSIFSIVPNLDPGETNVKVDMGKNTKIVILIPRESYSRYRNMSGLLALQPVMHQMIILPALMHVLEELKASRAELYIYEDSRWFRSLRKAAEKFNVILDESGLSALDTYRFAQQLLNTPLIKAMLHLSAGYEG